MDAGAQYGHIPTDAKRRLAVDRRRRRCTGTRRPRDPLGGTSLCHSASGIAARLAGVSISVGRIALQRTPSGRPSAATALARTRSPRPWTPCSRRRPRTGSAPPRRRCRRSSRRRALTSRGSDGLRDQVGRAQVEREQPLELGHRRVGHRLVGGEPADQVDQRPQRRPSAARTARATSSGSVRSATTVRDAVALRRGPSPPRRAPRPASRRRAARRRRSGRGRRRRRLRVRCDRA